MLLAAWSHLANARDRDEAERNRGGTYFSENAATAAFNENAKRSEYACHLVGKFDIDSTAEL